MYVCISLSYIDIEVWELEIINIFTYTQARYYHIFNSKHSINNADLYDELAL